LEEVRVESQEVTGLLVSAPMKSVLVWVSYFGRIFNLKEIGKHS
jgi:hypothetical protein